MMVAQKSNHLAIPPDFLPSLKLTFFAPENRPKPKRKRESLPTIHFQGLCHVSFREGRCFLCL